MHTFNYVLLFFALFFVFYLIVTSFSSLSYGIQKSLCSPNSLWAAILNMQMSKSPIISGYAVWITPGAAPLRWMGPNRNPRWEQKRTEGYVIVSISISDVIKVGVVLFSPNTTSDGSAGFWEPHLVNPDQAEDIRFAKLFVIGWYRITSLITLNGTES
jgi:hypothetical protein